MEGNDELNQGRQGNPHDYKVGSLERTNQLILLNFGQLSFGS